MYSCVCCVASCLYASFTSPFADGPSRKEPEYHLPLCYYMQPPMQPAESKVQLFSDETLIYAFYALPRDLLQVTAAVELYVAAVQTYAYAF